MYFNVRNKSKMTTLAEYQHKNTIRTILYNKTKSHKNICDWMGKSETAIVKAKMLFRRVLKTN